MKNVRLSPLSLLPLMLMLLLCSCVLTDKQQALDARVESSLAEQNWDKKNVLKTQLNKQEAYAFNIDYAKFLYTSERYNEAETLLNNLRKNPTLAKEAYPLLAQVYEKNNKPELAFIAWQELRKISNTGYAIDGEMARSALLCAQYDVADKIYTSWMYNTTPQEAIYISGLNNLGFSLLLQERYNEAETLFNEALANDPLNSKARSNLNRLNTIR
ncbi:MAG: tetratricopeptide repeat protein [Spirochaetales bacterium]|jgi:predicted Zn-dependent protease|nr:tetratricopeptide repeat protein [Spirochaetales bacterium]